MSLSLYLNLFGFSASHLNVCFLRRWKIISYLQTEKRLWYKKNTSSAEKNVMQDQHVLICERHTTIWRMHQIAHMKDCTMLFDIPHSPERVHTTLARHFLFGHAIPSRTHLIYASQMNFPTIKKYKIPQPKSSRLCARDFLTWRSPKMNF